MTVIKTTLGNGQSRLWNPSARILVRRIFTPRGHYETQYIDGRELLRPVPQQVKLAGLGWVDVVTASEVSAPV